MNKCKFCALLFAVCMQAQAANRAVEINVGSIGGAIDAPALRAVRQIVGFGIASGAVDSFTVYSPRPGAIPKEGGISACADMGFAIGQSRFNAFIQDLKTIKVKAGTVYSVKPKATACPSPQEPIVCTQDVKQCPDGSFVSRQPPSCAFAQCPTVK
jgi:hypothetical protein